MTPTTVHRRAVRVTTARGFIGTTVITLECGHQLRITEAERVTGHQIRLARPGQVFDCPACAETEGEQIVADVPHTD